MKNTIIINSHVMDCEPIKFSRVVPYRDSHGVPVGWTFDEVVVARTEENLAYLHGIEA